MDRAEWAKVALLVGLFLVAYLAPIDAPVVVAGVGEGLALTRWYAREHVILCLVPAFLIAGAIGALVDKGAVIRFLGPRANRAAAYGVGATGGCVLAVCSCTVLPLFAGIRRMGAGLGPAMAFLYAGPAINVLAIILTARVLGLELGVARAVGAVGFSVVVGLLMASMFERRGRGEGAGFVAPDTVASRPAGHLAWLFGLMVGVLVFANWGAPAEESGVWRAVYEAKWGLTGGAGVGLGVVLWLWFGFAAAGLIVVGAICAVLAAVAPEHPDLAFGVGSVGLCVLMARGDGAAREWLVQSWGYAKQITPLLLAGVFVAGMLLGRPGAEGLVPSAWIESSVGGNGVGANLGASLVGALMYFATLTEVPILEGLIGAGMGDGPALALLLAGPALSLPNMLVIRSVIGTGKTAAYVVIVVIGSTLMGLLYGVIV